MNALRATVRLVAFFAWIIGLFALRLVQRDRVARYRLFRWWSAGTQRIAGIRLTVTGAAPRPPFILVCNHLSYVDIVLLAGLLDARYVAKLEVAHWPILGKIVGSMDTIFVNRQHARDLLRANADIADAVTARDGVVIFAEGTSTRGETILPLQPSLLEIPAKQSLPVHYATIHYSQPTVCWWGDDVYFPHFFRTLALPGFAATIRFDQSPVTATDRKLLARQLHQKMSEQFTPTTPR